MPLALQLMVDAEVAPTWSSEDRNGSLRGRRMILSARRTTRLTTATGPALAEWVGESHPVEPNTATADAVADALRRQPHTA